MIFPALVQVDGIDLFGIPTADDRRQTGLQICDRDPEPQEETVSLPREIGKEKQRKEQDDLQFEHKSYGQEKKRAVVFIAQQIVQRHESKGRIDGITLFPEGTVEHHGRQEQQGQGSIDGTPGTGAGQMRQDLPGIIHAQIFRRTGEDGDQDPGLHGKQGDKGQKYIIRNVIIRDLL